MAGYWIGIVSVILVWITLMVTGSAAACACDFTKDVLPTCTVSSATYRVISRRSCHTSWWRETCNTRYSTALVNSGNGQQCCAGYTLKQNKCYKADCGGCGSSGVASQRACVTAVTVTYQVRVYTTCGFGNWQRCTRSRISTRQTAQNTCCQGYSLYGNICTSSSTTGCSTNNGGCSHTCSQQPTGAIVCSCRQGYQLMSDRRSCQDINECTLGTAMCMTNSQCVNSLGSYQCHCKAGFTQISNYCQDINECTSGSPCGAQSCVNTLGSYICSCAPGYLYISGGCRDIDECTAGTHSCNAHTQRCVNQQGSYSCVCGLATSSCTEPCCCGVSKYLDAGGISGSALLSPRIVGGYYARPNEFPWQASLRWTMNKLHHFCGAILIAPDRLLTAAHCMQNQVLGQFQAYLGDHSLSGDETTQRVVGVRDFTIHPQFEPVTLYNDLAVIRLYYPVTYDANIRPVCLPEPGDNFLGERGVSSGWGKDRNGYGSNVLKYGRFTVIPRATCAGLYNSLYFRDTLCVSDGTGDTTTSSCDGDSGGPLTVLKQDGKHYLAGVTSFGTDTCAMGIPSGFKDVVHHLTWIKQQLV